ncbi:hypothetical protein J3R74_000428 [Puniceicoccus vermicola]
MLANKMELNLKSAVYFVLSISLPISVNERSETVPSKAGSSLLRGLISPETDDVRLRGSWRGRGA